MIIKKMIKKGIIQALIFFIFCFQLQAQITDKNHNIFHDCSLGFGVGTTHFYGDIMEKDAVEKAFSVQLDIPIESHKYFLQAEFIRGSISGVNSFSYSCDNPRHTIDGVLVQHITEGEIFNMEYMEFDINFLISISRLFDEIIDKRASIPIVPKNNKLDFLCKVGVGLNMFRSLRKELETKEFINSYGYEWLWQNDFENAGTKKDETVNEGVFVLGIIANYKVSESVKINFSATSRIGDTDKWDAKINGKNDMFMFYSLGTTFKIFKN